MNSALREFIDQVYHEPYFPLTHNCIHKSLKIKARAEAMGERADLVLCLSFVRIKRMHNLGYLSPRVYTLINGEKVDVALNPDLEQVFGKNNEQKILIPLNISWLWRNLTHFDGLKLHPSGIKK